MSGDAGSLKICARDWVKLSIALFGHAFVVFGLLLHWTNRIVAVEENVQNVETQVSTGLAEVRADIKEILKRTKQ